MARGQSIRTSQFITTYGVGHIIENPQGPRVISTIEDSELFKPHGDRGLSIKDYEISELRLSSVLREEESAGTCRIFRLPTNAELEDVAETEPIYDTNPFPDWSLCVEHGILYRLRYGETKGCPECGKLSRGRAWKKAREEAIRFVQVCPRGHMDDVFWNQVVHGGSTGCRPDYFRWIGGGGSLSNITIKCPKCGAETNFGDAYKRPWNCSGRFPEEGRSRPGCNKNARIIPRSASNIRVPDTVSSLTIPPHTTRLHQILALENISSRIITGEAQNPAELIEKVRKLVENDIADKKALRALENAEEEDISEAMERIRKDQTPDNVEDLKREEFEALRNAARRGAVSEDSSTPHSPPLFEVKKEKVETFQTQFGKLRVTPVNRLRVVLAQKGYHRLKSDNHLVRRYYSIGGTRWYPGVELSGEGVFIDLVDEDVEESVSLSLGGNDATRWLEESRENPEIRHPVFVWWHSFAHRLIKSLSVDSGYSSAAIRERVFSETEMEDPEMATGGILLYAVQRGGDGTLGGLISLAPDFDRVINSALQDIEFCSNDPLCKENRFEHGKVNGAACYACLFLSETSCDHFNTNLDRNILRENCPEV